MKSSELVAAAEDWVKLAWPFIPRMFTYIDPFKVKPYHDRKNREMIFGRCYTLNDWREVGFTRNGLITLAKDFIPLNAPMALASQRAQAASGPATGHSKSRLTRCRHGQAACPNTSPTATPQSCSTPWTSPSKE